MWYLKLGQKPAYIVFYGFFLTWLQQKVQKKTIKIELQKL